jgi:hypothetical protein
MGYKCSSAFIVTRLCLLFSNPALARVKKRMIRSGRAVARPLCVSFHSCVGFASPLPPRIATGLMPIGNLLTSRPVSMDYSVIQTLAVRHDPGRRLSPGRRVVGTTFAPPGWPDARAEMLQSRRCGFQVSRPPLPRLRRCPRVFPSPRLWRSLSSPPSRTSSRRLPRPAGTTTSSP